MSLDDLIADMEDLISKMRYVTDGQYVISEDHNLFYDYVSDIVSAVEQLYEKFKAKTGKTLPDVEYWIEMAKSRHDLDRKVKYGDIVLSRDHNLIIDTLKPLELTMQRIEEELSSS